MLSGRSAGLLLRPPSRLFGGRRVSGERVELLLFGGWLLLGEEGYKLGDVILGTRHLFGLEEDVKVVLTEVGWELSAGEGGGGAELLLRLALRHGVRRTCPRRNQLADDDVLLQADQAVAGARDRRLGEDAGRLLEGGGGEEALRV